MTVPFNIFMTISCAEVGGTQRITGQYMLEAGNEGLRPPSLLRPFDPLDLLHICDQLHPLDLF